MASVTVEIRGNTGFLDRILQRVGVNTPAVTLDIAQDIRDDIKASWSGHYPPASAPGNPPAIRSGKLDTSIIAMPQQNMNSGKVTVIVVAAAPYAKPLEYGSYKMQARPFVRPPVKRAEKTFKGRWKAIFTR